MVSIALGSSTMVIKVILIHTTCMNGEADDCHLVSMYAYMHLAFKELIGQQPPLRILQAMTFGQKYHFLKHHDHFVPSIDHTFPEECMRGCKRHFN